MSVQVDIFRMHFHLNMNAGLSPAARIDDLPNPTNRCSFEKCSSEALTYFLEQKNRFNSNDSKCIWGFTKNRPLSLQMVTFPGLGERSQQTSTIEGTNIQMYAAFYYVIGLLERAWFLLSNGTKMIKIHPVNKKICWFKDNIHWVILACLVGIPLILYPL